MVEQKKALAGKATLGTVIGELGKSASHLWKLVLPDANGQPHDVAHLVGMMEVLWQAQAFRHGGTAVQPKSRRQDEDEARAVVPLAAVLVH